MVRLKKHGATNITSPWTVRATACSQPNHVILHLVNYDREESQNKKLRGSELERPKPVDNILVDFHLTRSAKVESVLLHTPDGKTTAKLSFQQSSNDRVRFRIPSMLVYAVIKISTSQQ
ncbi:MAG: hypothetical protein CMJ78_17010 [Planctomycetaceae bacterium]|nr:hypothetical protein [Planctomycetaceae bacterium]